MWWPPSHMLLHIQSECQQTFYLSLIYRIWRELKILFRKMFTSAWLEVPKSDKYVVFMFSYMVIFNIITPRLNSTGGPNPQHLNFKNYSLSVMIVLSHTTADWITVEIKSLCAFAERYAVSQASDESMCCSLKYHFPWSYSLHPLSRAMWAEIVIPVWLSEGYLEFLVIMKKFHFLLDRLFLFIPNPFPQTYSHKCLTNSFPCHCTHPSITLLVPIFGSHWFLTRSTRHKWRIKFSWLWEPSAFRATA